MTERGRIRNPELALVERDFSGLRWGAITPTDIDGFVEFSDRLYMFIEGKYGDSKLKGGQAIALNRLCDAIHDPEKGRYAVLFVVAHDGSQRFDYSGAYVTQYRWNGKSITPASPTTLKLAMDIMRDKCLGNVRSISESKKAAFKQTDDWFL